MFFIKELVFCESYHKIVVNKMLIGATQHRALPRKNENLHLF